MPDESKVDLPPDDAATESPAIEESDAEGSDFFTFPVSPTTSITEEFFSSLGPLSCANGWAVIPQERGERRMPGRVDREVLKPSKYHEVGPTPEEVRYWATQHFSTNVAAILGPASGGVWALDIDVSDLELVLAIEDAAFETLGHTHFRRIGNDPKRALLYRAATPDLIPRSRQMHLLDRETQSPTGHLVEFLGARKMLTMYGRHHSTLRSFTWADEGQPASHSVLDVPIVTSEQISSFTEALHAILPISGGPSMSTVGSFGGWIEEAAETTIVTPPRIRTRTEQARWVLDEHGRVADGREAFLYSVARTVVTQNAGAALSSEGQDELRAVIRRLFRENEGQARRWADSRLGGQINGKVNALVAQVLAGKIGRRSYAPKMKSATTDALPHDRTHGDTHDRGTAWLEAPRDGKVMRPAPVGDRRRSTDMMFEGVAQAEIPADLRIAATPQEAIDQVAGGVYRYIDPIIREHYDRRLRESRGETLTPFARLLKSSAGSGKTTSTMRLIAKHAAQFIASTQEVAVDAPILFLVPGYALAHQVLDDAIKSGVPRDRIVFYVGQAKSSEYEGGCRFPEQVKILQEAGKSASRMCASEFVNAFGEKEVAYCPFYANCLFQENKKKIASADLVIAVHNYATVQLPQEFSDCRLVIIDETISFERSYEMDVDTLFWPRNVPRLTKKEREEGVDPMVLMDDRVELAEVAWREIKAKRDPARWFAVDGRVGGREVTSEQKRKMLKNTIAILGRIDDIDEVRPGLTADQIAEICRKPTQKKIQEEWKFWRLIEDRVELLVPDLLNAALYDAAKKRGSNAPRPEMKAKGKTDRRIHHFRGPNARHNGTLRMSWIAEHNFADRDLLFLDASASEVLLEKGLGKDKAGRPRQLVCQEISARDRVRTVYVPGLSLSKSSILPRERDAEEMLLTKAQLRVDIRRSLTAICAMHVGGVVACASMFVEKYILDGWAPPKNLHFLHYNAIKGLNFAKGYDAAVAIGCLNVSGRQIDDIVAAYVADDDAPEAMLDPIGEHKGPEDPDPLFIEREVVVQLRNGAKMRINQRSVEGEIAQIVYDQVRRENWLQFYARLRGVLRDDISTFYALGSYLPEKIIVDEILPFEDLARFGEGIEPARRHQCPIASEGVDWFDEEHEAGLRFAEMAARTPSVSRNLIHLRVGDRVMYAPAFLSDVVDRMLEDGEAEVVYRPHMESIVKPDGHDVDVYVHTRRDDEESTRDDVFTWMDLLGWSQPVPGSASFANVRFPGKFFGSDAVVEVTKTQIAAARDEYLAQVEAARLAWEDHEVEAFNRALMLQEMEAY